MTSPYETVYMRLFAHRVVEVADVRVIATNNCMCMMYFLMEKRLQTSFLELPLHEILFDA